MSATFRILSIARFANKDRMTGRQEVKHDPKNYTSQANALRYGVPAAVKGQGNTFVVIEGAPGELRTAWV